MPIVEGWYTDARRVESPNCNDRPEGAEISLLVIHNISLPPGDYHSNSVEAFFCNRLDPSAHPYFETIATLQVSAHCFIRRNGELIQFVPFQARAWHAGRSEFEGEGECNNYSIGIELEGTDTEPYTDQQYGALAEISSELLEKYPKITRYRIVGHSDIAPNRKTDPGPSFDWHRYRAML